MNSVTLTKELVAFASPSHVSNDEVSQFVADQLRCLGFKLELNSYRDRNDVEKVNVLAQAGPPDGRSSGRPGLAYCCHSDVVPADNWIGPGGPYTPVEEAGKLFGRGSCDMKGSAACMLAALEQIDLAQLRAPVYFLCTADEELSYAGAQNVVSTSSTYRDMVATQPNTIIGEPTELHVVHAHKGICKLCIISHGEAAHSSTRQGLNANLAMIPFLQKLKAIHDETESNRGLQDPMFDPPTMSWNIGINDHTAAINVKPAKSVCTVFFRPLPNVDDRPLIDRVRAAAGEHGLEFAEPDRCAAMFTDPNQEVVTSALRLAGQTNAETVSYGTDGGVMTELERKIVCGPGSIAQAHTPDEWISIEQLHKGTELYRAFLEAWCLAP